MKALPIDVYKTGKNDYSNGGVTSKHSGLLLICPEGFISVDETNPPENLVKLVKRKLFGEEYLHIEPYASPDPGNVGWMSGGCLGYSSDSRFSRMSKYPLRIHDRQETQSMYDRLSR